ncbi:MAG: YbdD/YjiX family protein [Gemmatimonadaceae bacterium]
MHRVLSAIRRMIGVPDYDVYVAHLRRAHPTVVPMPPEEFLRRRLDDRYSRPGARCC